MLSLLIVILILIGSAVVSSIYSSFAVFYSNFSESESYHKAYYASISALERGELVVKQRKPGYVGSGGFIFGSGQGTYKTGGSDKYLSGFSYLWEDKDSFTVFWTINSLTNRIPAEGKGDVEWSLSTGDSENYNMMNYEDTEIFLLYYDTGSKDPYSGGSIVTSNISSISGEIRLPGLLRGRGFGDLDTGMNLAGPYGNLPIDDAIVDWQIMGNYGGEPFIIYSTPKITTTTVTYRGDSVFRESDINLGLRFNFGSSRDPLVESPRGDSVQPTIISQKESDIKNLSDKFYTIFSNATGVQLRFSLGNLLQGKGITGTGHNYYPFLEYYANLGGNVPDKYFTINAEGNFHDYQVNTIIQKPTVKESIFGNFTSIF